MDQASFDRIARTLGAAVTRRAGLGAALAAAVALPVTSTTASIASAARRPKPEGPCGNGSRKDNMCTKDSQCCTGVCKKGIKNKDGKGRCRCVRRGKACKEDKNCCKGSCVGGFCGGAAVSCDVCLSGCPYSTVQAALDGVASGATITIDGGTWDEDLTVSKTVTLTPCGKAVTLRNATAATRTIVFGASAPIDTMLTIDSITITTSTPGDGGGIAGFGNLTLRGTAKVKDCAAQGSGGGMDIGDGTNPFTVLITDSAEVSGNLSQTEGSGIYIADSAILTLSGNALVTNNGDGSTDGGGVYMYNDAVLVMSGNAVVSNNRADIGGGVFLYGGSNQIMTMKDNATVKDNTALQGGGIHVESSLVMEDASVVSGNSATSASGGGGVYVNPFASMTMSGTASIRSNTSANNGGGMVIESGSATLSGNATITLNQAAGGPSGGGGGVSGENAPAFPAASLTVTAPATITANTPDQCGGTVSC